MRALDCLRAKDINPQILDMKPEILLKAYVQYQSEDAFRELVAATLDEVYSTSLRITQGSQRLAEETALNAYLALARNAPGIKEDVMLASWLRKRACKIAVRILRAGERDIDWRIVKKEKDVRSTPSEVQPAPPGLAIYICKTVFLTVKRRRGFRLWLPRISWPTWMRPLHVGGAAVGVLAIMVWWHNPFHRHNQIIRSQGALMKPTSFAQLASPEEWGGPVANTNALTNTNQK
jgi:hypothetical protein